jgi:hypothetical protein
MSTTTSCPATIGWKPGKRQAIVAFHAQHPLEGYRRLTYGR